MALSAGTRLGPYEILSPLGAGGMGEVYRACDTRLGRDVAVKVLPDTVSNDPRALSRFEHEAKAVAALSHPNILALFDVGEAGGIHYAVTELLEGENLRALVSNGPLPVRRALEIAEQVAQGLAAAHEKGIVHRDIKPENVFLTKDGHVKVLDFGLARSGAVPAGRDETESPTVEKLTSGGAVVGTVAYMSPEQARGLPVDHRSDQFSLGIVLYEILAGHRPFKGASAAETLTAIIREEPEPLSKEGPPIPAPVRWLVERCLAKEAVDRYDSTRDLRRDLENCRVHLADIGSAASALVVTAGVRPPRRLVVAAILGVALVALLAVLFVRRKSAPPSGAPAVPHGGTLRIVVLPFENLGGPEDDYFADGMADAVRGKLTSLPGVEVIARASSTTYKKTTKTPKQVAEELNVSYLLTATVRWQKSGDTSRVEVSPELVDVTRPDAPTSKWQQPFDAALTDVFRVQSDIATRVAQALGVALGAGEEKRLGEKPTRDLAAYEAFLMGEEAENRSGTDPAPYLRKALGFYEQAVTLDPGFALAWAKMSRCSSGLYLFSIPIPELATRARQAAEKAVALAPNRPEGFLALGLYERSVHTDFNRALEQFAKGRRISPDNADLLWAMAEAERSLGRWEAALGHLRQAERLDPRSVNNSLVSINLVSVGNALLWLRRYPAAREALDRSLALTPSSLNLIESKAMTFLGEGNLVGARAVFNAATKDSKPAVLVAFFAVTYDLVWVLDEERREILLSLPPSAFDDDRGNWALCLVQAHALKGDAANVRLYAEEAGKAYEEQLRATPNDAQRHILLGLALAYLGRKEEAIREGERGVAMEPVSKDAFGGCYFQHQLARIYMLVGEPEKALDNLEPLLKIPSYLTPGWLRIDPNFDPLRKNPRFQKLVAGK